MPDRIDLEQLCADKGLRITEQRRVIARVLSDSEDHPDVELLHSRASAIDPKISIATVYRTVRLFEEAGILDRHDFGDGRARYEPAPEAHHDHLIDVESGKVVEFVDPELEALQKQIAEKLGYRLVDHRMELYWVRCQGCTHAAQFHGVVSFHNPSGDDRPVDVRLCAAALRLSPVQIRLSFSDAFPAHCCTDFRCESRG